ncbi:MAG: septum formation initiator family protein [Kiritimatiellae bacterium]|nr:septum formation initiator family protein [Kiritimatiellia bacterium]MCO5067641.1 septum formation initiator family protein [Kiritimatiellia bacterium]
MNIWGTIIRICWVALALILLAGLVGIFYPKVRQHQDLQRRNAELQEEVKIEEEMLQHLKSKQDRLRNDPRFVEKIAREDLGLAKPGETVFKFIDDAPTNTRTRPRR